MAVQNIHFQELITLLDERGCLPAVVKQSRIPEEQRILSKLLDLGVAPNALTHALAKVFALDIYDRERHGEFETLAEDKTWGIAGDTFFTTNPFERSLQPAAVVTSRESADIHRFGLLPVGFSEQGNSKYENDAAAERQIRAWITQAYRAGGSDIHIAPLSVNYVRVRTRVDGRLQSLAEVQMCPDETERSYRYISNMLMRLAGLEAGAFMKPADGSFNLKLASEILEVRLSMRPVVVQRQASQAFYLRLFGNHYANKLTRISVLGLSEQVEKTFAAVRSLNQNLVLVTGPTGSGKSTTLYANLREILYETPGRSIQTLEDPVECHIDGIEQTEVNERSGMSFEAGLRGMMRSDVDVILLGEVRDSETANLAVRASLTGHLIFATIHTKSALAAIDRFIDFGVSRKMLATVLAGVFSQRLVRKICTLCHRQQQHCSQCSDGYAGRYPVAEFIKIDNVLRMAIIQECSAQQLETLARQRGNQMLWDCADKLIKHGITTLEECRTQLPPRYSTDGIDGVLPDFH